MIIGKIRTLLEIDTKNGLVPRVEFEGKKQRPVTFDELAYYNDQAGGGHLCIPKPDFDGAYDLFKEVAPLSKPPAPTAAPRVADRSKGSGASSPAIVGTPVKAPPVKDQCDNTSKETNETRPPSSHPSAPGVDATSPSPAVEHPVLLTTSRVNQIPPKHPQGASKKTNSIGGNSNPVPRPSSAGEDEVVSRSSMYSLLDADDTTSATRDIDQAFFEAVKIAKTLPSNLSSDAKLSIYAHYKMAMNGPCDSNVKVPGVFDVVGRAKYDAWKKLSDSDAVNSSSSRNAKKAYVDLVERLKEAHSK